MKEINIKSFNDYVSVIEKIRESNKQIVLYRGQSSDLNLLPSIAREYPANDTTTIEREMLEELKRRSQLLITRHLNNDWEWLIFAQHFGLKTRLLDWTSNPLMALWFACKNEYAFKKDSYVYVLKADNSMLVDFEKTESPFQHSATRILRPSLNNERIVAQSGWFTAHKFSKKGKRFVPLETNRNMKGKLVKIIIPSKSKENILSSLAVFGVNNRTVFPDISGLCAHLNWIYGKKINGGD